MSDNIYPEYESATVELKSTLPKSKQIIKTLIAFCNLHGGKLVVGVADDRRILGLSEDQIQECLEWLEKAVHDASFPPIIPSASLQRIEEKSVLVIEVSSGMSKPYYLKAEGIEKGTYIRLGRNTFRATPEMINELRWQSEGVHFETLPVYQATMEDLDSKAINHFLNTRKNRGKAEDSKEMRLAYKLATTEHAHDYPTTAGMLLFGKQVQNYFSEAMIICTHFQGNEGRDVIATFDCEGTISHQFRMAYDFILSRLTRAFVVDQPQRTETLEVPKEAIREAILNAIVHRNYYLKSPIKIAIWTNRIEIFSPGAFPGPIDVQNLRTGRSYMRNPNICKVFRESGYIEKLGSGFIVMLSAYQAANLPPPQVIDGGDFVKCILPRPAPYERQEKTGDLSARIVGLLQAHSELSFKELTTMLGMPRTTLNRIVTELINEGVIQRTGKTRAIRYRLTRNK